MSEPIDLAKADSTKEMLPGGEGVDPVPIEDPILDPAVTPTPAAADVIMRQAYEAAEAAAKKTQTDSSLSWQSTPQSPGQVGQPGLSRPGKYETYVLNLSVSDDRKKHDELMSMAQRPEASFLLQRERQWSPDTQTWHVLLELQYFEFLHTLSTSKTPAP